MGTAVDTPAIVKDAIEDALRLAKKRGFDIEPDARGELADLVDQGFREMAASRVLDLADAERTRAFSRARTSLDDFLTRWMRIEKSNGNATLTVPGFRTAQSEGCPVYPF